MLVARNNATRETRERERKGRNSRALTLAGSRIDGIPRIVDLERRESCQHSLKLFLETYFPKAFWRGWSQDHLEVIEKTQTAVLRGGMFAVAMPRSSGKTTINLRAAMWAISYGLCRYAFIVSADAGKAEENLDSIKTEFRFNDLLYEDFPEICIPVRQLEGVAQAGVKQHVNGDLTLIKWKAKRVQLPHVDGSLASGALIGVGGITGAARGAQVTLPSGEVKRPSVILVDDFQTRESSASATQCKTRLDTLTGDICGMRGPGEPLAILVTGTVIYQGDAMDQLLDRKRFPEWHGTRKKLVYAWPTNEKLWEEYGELRKQAFLKDQAPIEANDYVAKHFAELHAGSEVAWPDRFDAERGELSALHHAYNLKLADTDAFAAEYQNEPVSQTVDDFAFLSADQISEKLTGRPRPQLPSEVEHVVSAIDVQGNSLWWMTVAWCEGFTGYIVDYNVFPKQNRRFFKQTELPNTFETLWPTLSQEEAIYRALDVLVSQLAEQRFILDSGAELGVSRILIDEGFKDSTVHLLCKQHAHKNILTPAKGWGVKAGGDPMNEWRVKTGEKAGWNWRLRLAENERSLRHVLWDGNSWKTFLQERLVVSQGGTGCLSICGNNPAEHRLLADHFTSEKCTRTEGRGRTLLEWKLPPSRPDNHWLDAAAMCVVAASMCGVKLLQPTKPQKKAKELSLEDYAKMAGRR